MPSVSPLKETNVERTTHAWAILDFGSILPSLMPKKRDKRADKPRQATERQVDTSELQLISKEFICGQKVKRTSIWYTRKHYFSDRALHQFDDIRQLELRRKGCNLSVSLACHHCFHEEVDEIWTRFDVDIVDLNGNVLYSEGGISYFYPENVTKFTPRFKINDTDAKAGSPTDRNSYWETDVISMRKLSKNLNEYVSRNILNLRLRLYVYREKPFNEANHMSEFHEPVKLCYTDSSIFQEVKKCNHFLQAVEALWETMEDADVMIKMDGEILRAHKFIVTVQSPVLKNMVGTQEKAKISGNDGIVVELHGHPTDALKLILKYFYTQDAEEVKVSTDIDFISRVLDTCNRLGVKSLARVCLVRLLTNMTTENFGETALAVYRNVVEEGSFFKSEVKRFLMENQMELQKSEEFRRHAKINHKIFLEICFEPIHLIMPKLNK